MNSLQTHHAVHDADGLRPAISVKAGESFGSRAVMPDFAKPRGGYTRWVCLGIDK